MLLRKPDRGKSSRKPGLTGNVLLGTVLRKSILVAGLGEEQSFLRYPSHGKFRLALLEVCFMDTRGSGIQEPVVLLE